MITLNHYLVIKIGRIGSPWPDSYWIGKPLIRIERSLIGSGERTIDAERRAGDAKRGTEQD